VALGYRALLYILLCLWRSRIPNIFHQLLLLLFLLLLLDALQCCYS
jgi:hypothetical protein